MKLDWKIPTWPGLVGLVGAIATVVTQVSHVKGVPLPLGAISGALLVTERAMQAVDYRSLQTAATTVVSVHPAVGAPFTAPSPAEPVVAPPDVAAAGMDPKDAEIAQLKAALAAKG
jgi:hypothetical protein